jgi:hypothetical protein
LQELEVKTAMLVEEREPQPGAVEQYLLLAIPEPARAGDVLLDQFKPGLASARFDGSPATLYWQEYQEPIDFPIMAEMYRVIHLWAFSLGRQQDAVERRQEVLMLTDQAIGDVCSVNLGPLVFDMLLHSSGDID